MCCRNPATGKCGKETRELETDPELATLLEPRAFAEQRCPEPRGSWHLALRILGMVLEGLSWVAIPFIWEQAGLNAVL